jgi:hypothetical protein
LPALSPVPSRKKPGHGCAEPAPEPPSRRAWEIPIAVTRRVSVRGSIMIGGQRIQVGLAHARKTAEVTVEADVYQISVEPGITITAPRTTSLDIRRHRASHYPGPQAAPDERPFGAAEASHPLDAAPQARQR